MTVRIDLVDQAAAYLKANGYSDAFLRRLDDMTGQEGIVVRRISERVVNTYMDGAQDLEAVYQVVCRYRSEEKALERCSAASQLLDGAVLPSANGSYCFESQTVYTEPQQLGLEEAGFYAWETRIIASIGRG